MNSLKPMKINYKRLFTVWTITLIIAMVIGASITALVMKPKPTIAQEAMSPTVEPYFFTPKVQVAEPTIEPTEPIIEEPVAEVLGEYRITAYCPCEICCGDWAKNRPNGIVVGAAGKELQEGVSVAASLPLGTKINIDGIGEYEVQDKIAKWVLEKYDNKVIGIYFESHEDAQSFGLQHKEVSIMKGDLKND